MEHYLVSARKYRPQTFEDVVGQQHITNTLENAIRKNHLAQALLFTGPRGVGKTTCARILAKKINEDIAGEGNNDFSFNIFELDAASNNSVDDIRSLTDQVRIPPQIGKFKVYIIDEVHMLSQAAFNAFLKTLEEPPKHVIFILATTEKHKIIPTILSRCQIFDFKRISVLDAKNYLQKIAEREGVKASEEALHIIAQKADGAMRDALSIFDRVASFSGQELSTKVVSETLNILDYDTYFNTTDLILEHDIPGALLHLNSILSKGFNEHQFIVGLANHFRDLLISKNKQTIELLEAGAGIKERYAKQSEKCEVDFLLKAIEIANDCDLKYKAAKNKRLQVEIALMQLASINFNPEKKKQAPIIISPNNFEQKPSINKEEPSVEPKHIEKPKSEKLAVEKSVLEKPKAEKLEIISVEEKSLEDSTSEIKQKETAVAIPKLNIEKRRPSSLSIKSVERQRKVAESEATYEKEIVEKPTSSFSENELQLLWRKYADELEKNGKKSVSSVLRASQPSVKDHKIDFTVASAIMQDQLELIKYDFVSHLQQELNNFKIQLNIIVNEQQEIKYAYTAQEKYQKLLEINPKIALLKTKFNLEL
jgi:DNA polymerase-3 subunit gamma/tau